MNLILGLTVLLSSAFSETLIYVSPTVVHAEEISQEVFDVTPVSTTTVKMAVENEFGTTSIMVEIARCESLYRQFDDGKVLRGEKDKDDTGVFQVNRRFHLKQSIKLGFDIDSLLGNISYAKWLYAQEGTRPWLASSKCWNKV